VQWIEVDAGERDTALVRYRARLYERPEPGPAPGGHLTEPTSSPAALPSPLRARINDIATLRSPWTQVGAVLDFVRQHYRYDLTAHFEMIDGLLGGAARRGAGNFILTAIHDVSADDEHLGRGACFELNTLVVELLRQINIPCMLVSAWVLDGALLEAPDHAFVLAFLPHGQGFVPVPVDAAAARGDPSFATNTAPTAAAPEAFRAWEQQVKRGEMITLDPIELEQKQIAGQQRALQQTLELYCQHFRVTTPASLRRIASRPELDPRARMTATRAAAAILARDKRYGDLLRYATRGSAPAWTEALRAGLDAHPVHRHDKERRIQFLRALVDAGLVSITPGIPDNH
jgi:hypothetical protein